MNAKKIILVVMALLFSLTFTAYANTEAATNYANPEHWLALPASPDKPVDVFYLFLQDPKR